MTLLHSKPSNGFQHAQKKSQRKSFQSRPCCLPDLPSSRDTGLLALFRYAEHILYSPATRGPDITVAPSLPSFPGLQSAGRSPTLPGPLPCRILPHSTYFHLTYIWLFDLFIDCLSSVERGPFMRVRTFVCSVHSCVPAPGMAPGT